MVFLASLYTLIVGTDSDFIIGLTIFGLTLGGLGSFMGWIIYFIHEEPLRIRCRCDNDT